MVYSSTQTPKETTKAHNVCLRVFLSLAMLVFAMSIPVLAQKYSVKGTIIDRDNTESLMGANVQLISLPDSTFIGGAQSLEDGSFEIQTSAKGKTAIKVSFIGFLTKVVVIDQSHKKHGVIDLGYVTMQSDSKLLQEAQVTAAAAKVQVSADSIIFNPSAYRVPQGSTLEALVKLLPGAKIDDQGNITINGKSVSKILVDGKEFFLNDKNVAMQNIPVDMIDRIKSYDRKSDMARVTGIDDGEEETVLDLTVKKGMQNGWIGNVNAGAGTEHRYNGRAMVNRFNDNLQVSVLGNARNTSERWGWNRNTGLSSYKELGGNFATTSPKFETGGSVTFRHNGSDSWSSTQSESFTAPIGRFGDRMSQSYASNNSWNGQMRLEWKPDSMTNIIFRPNFTYSRNNGYSFSSDYSYNEDPDTWTASPLDSIIMRFQDRRGQTFSNSSNFQGMLQINRKFNNRGRNLTLRINGNYTSSTNYDLSATNEKKTDLHQIRNYYYETPSHNRGITVNLSYSEPIADRTYLQFTYQFGYTNRKNDRLAQMYESAAYQELNQALMDFRYDIDAINDFMHYELQNLDKLCRDQEHTNITNTFGIQFRRVRKEYNMSFGIDALPQTTKLKMSYMNNDYPEITRNVFYIAPRAQLRYNFDQHTNLMVRYNSRTQQPDMVDLLNIVDDSEPSRIKLGNTNLKPSMSHQIMGNFHTFDAESQRSIFVFGNANLQQNSIVRKTIYMRSSTDQATRPMNVNGNWSAMLGTGFNTGLGKNKRYTAGFDIRGNYSHSVGYYTYVDNKDQMLDEELIDSDNQKSLTKNLSLNFGLNTAYRNDYVNFELRGDVAWQQGRNNVNNFGNNDTYTFNYGGRLEWSMPWGTELATDMFMNSRRGYQNADMNTNELLWNASLSHSFLRGKVLTIKAEIYDILGQQTNLTRTYNYQMRSDSRTNAIYQYGMITAIYRFSIFGGRNAVGTSNDRQEQMWSFPGGGFGGPRPGGGGPRPGGGGPRPGGGGPRR